MKQKLDIYALRNITRSRRKSSNRVSSIEQSIITVQQYFLTPGVHGITVPSQMQGRSLLRVCLDSLGLYFDIGMVSCSGKQVPAHYRDLYDEMIATGSLEGDSGALEEFLLTSFSCDFLVLEYTQDLMNQPWFGKFEQLLHDYSLAQTIPVIMFLYEDNTLAQN